MIRCLITSISMSPKLNTSFGMTSLCMLRWLGRGFLILPRLTSTKPNPSLKVLNKVGVKSKSFVEGTHYISFGIGKDNVAR